MGDAILCPCSIFVRISACSWLLVVLDYALNSGNKLLRPIEPYVYNYIAQMMFALPCCGSILFAQYLTIWYG